MRFIKDFNLITMPLQWLVKGFMLLGYLANNCYLSIIVNCFIPPMLPEAVGIQFGARGFEKDGEEIKLIKRNGAFALHYLGNGLGESELFKNENDS